MKKKMAFLVSAAVLISIAILSSGIAYAVTCPNSSYNVVGGVCVPNNTGLSSKPVSSILATLLQWLLYILTGIAVLAFIISGMQYLTAVGDEERVGTAKSTMKYAIIGIVVAISGLVIIRTIANILSAANNSSLI